LQPIACSAFLSGPPSILAQSAIVGICPTEDDSRPAILPDTYHPFRAAIRTNLQPPGVSGRRAHVGASDPPLMPLPFRRGGLGSGLFVLPSVTIAIHSRYPLGHFSCLLSIVRCPRLAAPPQQRSASLASPLPTTQPPPAAPGSESLALRPRMPPRRPSPPDGAQHALQPRPGVNCGKIDTVSWQNSAIPTNIVEIRNFFRLFFAILHAPHWAYREPRRARRGRGG
jgi:hypothetical protein